MRYDHVAGRLQLWSFEPDSGWKQHGAETAVTFAAGERFGVRATAGGTVAAYRDTGIVGTWEVGGWTFTPRSGRIGFAHAGAAGALLV